MKYTIENRHVHITVISKSLAPVFSALCLSILESIIYYGIYIISDIQKTNVIIGSTGPTRKHIQSGGYREVICTETPTAKHLLVC
jgi:hypothetical protein